MTKESPSEAGAKPPVLLLEVKDRVALLTLNRPERLNAWNDALALALRDALARCDEDDEVRAVVITGAGKAFCAGADMSGGGSTFEGSGRRESRGAVEALGLPRRAYGGGPFPFHLRKPVYAAINGHAIGVGITYPMTCDVRLVAEDAKVQFAFVRRGVLPELWSHVIVPRVAGLSRAADLMLSGRMIRGREMAELGLASEALPADQVLPATLERAREIAGAAPASVAVTKHLLWEGLGVDLDAFGRREARLFGWLTAQPDAREGVLSFLEKRAPDWKGHASDWPDEADPSSASG